MRLNQCYYINYKTSTLSSSLACAGETRRRNIVYFLLPSKDARKQLATTVLYNSSVHFSGPIPHAQ